MKESSGRRNGTAKAAHGAVCAVATLLLLACPLMQPVARAGRRWRVGVIPYADKNAELDRLIRDRKRDVDILRLSAGELVAKLRKFNGVVITARERFRGEWVAALERFVERGGCLALVGKAVRFVEPSAKKSGEAHHAGKGSHVLESLAGSRVTLVGFRAERMRVFEDNPFFRGFHVGRWIPYPETAGKPWTLVHLSAGASKVLAGVELSRAKRGAGDGVPESSFYGAFYSGEAPFLTVCSRGAGLVVRVAEDVLARRRDSGMFEALLNNLFSEDCWYRARCNFDGYGTPQPRYAGGNLIENGDIEKVFLVREKSPRKDNRIDERPYYMPVAWGYNAHGAVFRGTAVKRENGGFCLFMERVGGAEDARLGRVHFSQSRPMNRLENGKSYELGFALRTRDVIRARADINYRLAGGVKKSRRFDLPAGTHSWRTVHFRFKLPRYVPPGEEPVRGFILYIMMDGGGKMWIDDVYLKAVKGQQG